jgi:hypothetical protein
VQSMSSIEGFNEPAKESVLINKIQRRRGYIEAPPESYPVRGDMFIDREPKFFQLRSEERNELKR